jgi:hypothetical protein
MVAGYLFESVLGFAFAVGFSISGLPSDPPISIHKRHLIDGCKVFFDCAVFFVVSIQISSVVVLARKDFGLSANGLGGLTVQITWAVALVCMLPLLYPMIILEYASKERANFRFFLFCGCWILFFYTFISQMIGNFAPSQVGEGAGPGGQTIVTTSEMDTLVSMCLGGIRVLSTTEQKVLSASGAVGSILISMYGLGYLLWFIGSRLHEDVINAVRTKISAAYPKVQKDRMSIITLGILLPLLTIPQFWGIFRLREIQRSLAGATSNAYVDNQWTFGQVVSVTIFAPVLTELGYLLLRGEPRKCACGGVCGCEDTCTNRQSPGRSATIQ